MNVPPFDNLSPARAAMLAAEDEARLQDAADAARHAAQRRAGEFPRLLDASDPLGLRRRPTPEQQAQIRAEDDARRRASRASMLMSNAKIPARYATADLANVDAVPGEARARYSAAVARLRETTRRPVIVMLCGTRGPGKTHMACGLIREFCRRGYTARYAKAMDYFKTIKREFGRKGGDEVAAEKQFTMPQLLVLDEMQVRSETDWENNQLTDLIDTRYLENRITVCITNLTPEAAKAAAGESVHNRLREGGVYIVCDWPSMRPLITPPELFAADVPLDGSAIEGGAVIHE